jgi:hypothetical protein
VKSEIAKPRSANVVADAATSANDIVPHRASAVHHESGAAGTTVRASPGAICPPCFSFKYATVERRGYGPTPATCHVCRVAAWWTRIGATPATLTMSQWTTPSVMPAATPASTALPPAARTPAAAAEASGCPAATAHRRPRI